MLKILLFAVLPLIGGGSIFSNVVGYDFTTQIPVIFENSKPVSFLLGQEGKENFFVPERIIFNGLTPIVERKSFLSVKLRDLFLIFSDPENPEIVWEKVENKSLDRYKRFTMTKFVKNKRLYSRKMLYK